MNLVYFEIVEDCIEAKNVYDAYLSVKNDEVFIKYLSNLGKFVYFDDFDKPYFKVIVRGKYTLKGIEDDMKIRILMPDDAGTESLAVIKEFINNFN